ncbi:peptidase inhibitor family I36 protein [Streptomyces sp. NPDC101152]|uniref:peptidase inhibitor family I36 protein n=1 Tax=Streptomyces sp. NPDC101152 TaxID=3366116 RepID=UPI0038261329
MRNRLFVGFATAGLILVSGVGTATQASAATPTGSSGAAVPTAVGKTANAAVQPAIVSGCSASYFCFWNNANYNDGPGKVSGNNLNWGYFQHITCPNGSWGGCASSLDNAGTSGMGVYVFSGADWGGYDACIADNATYSNLAGWNYGASGVNMNDTIWSNKWTWDC